MKKNQSPLDVANKEIKELNKQIETLNAKVFDLEYEREVFRGFVKSEFKAHFEIVGTAKYWSPQAVIQRILSEVLPNVSPFRLWS